MVSSFVPFKALSQDLVWEATPRHGFTLTAGGMQMGKAQTKPSPVRQRPVMTTSQDLSALDIEI